MRSIPSVCAIGGGGSTGGGGTSQASPSLASQFLNLMPATQAGSPSPQDQVIPGLTMPPLGGGGFVNAPMPQSHGAYNAAIAKMILSLL